MSGTRTRLAALLLAAAASSGCESFPVVRVSVFESGAEDTPRFARVSADDPPPPEESRIPVPAARVVVCEPDADCLDPSDVELFAATFPAVGSKGRKGVSGRLPIAMRTDRNGAARYAEFRYRPVFFLPTSPLRRRVRVSAEGFEPQDVTIEIGDVTYSLDVPLRRR